MGEMPSLVPGLWYDGSFNNLRRLFMLLRTILLFSVMVSVAQAEVKLDGKDILGVWQIDAESNNSDGSKPRKLNATWEFREDGTIESIILDPDVNARAPTMRASVTYTLEDGKLVKQTIPGRSKFETCVATEKTDTSMTLQCGATYFFMTKK
jgi:hypothetical protein